MIGSFVYEARRTLLWGGSPFGVAPMRFDAAKAEMTSMKDFVPPPTAGGE